MQEALTTTMLVIVIFTCGGILGAIARNADDRSALQVLRSKPAPAAKSSGLTVLLVLAAMLSVLGLVLLALAGPGPSPPPPPRGPAGTHPPSATHRSGTDAGVQPTPKCAGGHRVCG